MKNKPFLLGATIEAAELPRQVYGSNEWVEVAAFGPAAGIRVELRVEGEQIVLRIVGFHPGRPSADREIYRDALPLPPAE